MLFINIVTIFFMKNLKNFETEEEFNNIKDSLEYPSLSYTDDNGKVWIENEQNYIIATYITSYGVMPASLDDLNETVYQIQLLSEDFNIDQIDTMYVDNELLETPVNVYSFTEEGEHSHLW